MLNAIFILASSAITSVITTKILATHYFKIVDGYVKEMCDETIESNKKMLTILHKLQRNSDQEG